MRPWSTRLACNSAPQSKPALPHRLSSALDSVLQKTPGSPRVSSRVPHQLMATTTTNISRGEPSHEPTAWPAAFTVEQSPWRLVTLSMLMLFVELALIRWTAANNVHLANITNFVLLASFLGIGVGFLRPARPAACFRLAPVSLAVLVAFALAFPVKLVTLRGPHEFEGISGHHPLSQWVSLPVIFVLVVLVMAGLGQATARTFRALRAPRRIPLRHHREHRRGSCCSRACPSSVCHRSPGGRWSPWCSCCLLGVRQQWWQWVAITAVVVMLLLESLSAVDIWSPYYKITAIQPPGTHGTLSVSANNIPHQTLYPDRHAAQDRVLLLLPLPSRGAPARLHNVLIIGAGHRQRRRRRPVRGCAARRCRRDRPRPRESGQEVQPRARLPEPARHDPHRRRAVVPPEHEPERTR